MSELTLVQDVDGTIHIPEKYFSDETYRVRIVMPYQTQIRTHKKDAMQESIVSYFRHKPQKPYIEEGFLEINGDRYKILKKEGKP